MVPLDRLQQMYEDVHKNKTKDKLEEEDTAKLGISKTNENALNNDTFVETTTVGCSESSLNKFKNLKYSMLATPFLIYAKIRSARRP